MKKITISVTGTFTATIQQQVTEEVFRQLDAETLNIEDIADEYELYKAANNSDCNMDWDYVTKKPRKKAAK
jgi:hypothetical protein